MKQYSKFVNPECDGCGESHPIMEDNGDGTFTCIVCSIAESDSSDIDNFGP